MHDSLHRTRGIHGNGEGPCGLESFVGSLVGCKLQTWRLAAVLDGGAFVGALRARAARWLCEPRQPVDQPCKAEALGMVPEGSLSQQSCGKWGQLRAARHTELDLLSELLRDRTRSEEAKKSLKQEIQRQQAELDLAHEELALAQSQLREEREAASELRAELKKRDATIEKTLVREQQTQARHDELVLLRELLRDRLEAGAREEQLRRLQRQPEPSSKRWKI